MLVLTTIALARLSESWRLSRRSRVHCLTSAIRLFGSVVPCAVPRGVRRERHYAWSVNRAIARTLIHELLRQLLGKPEYLRIVECGFRIMEESLPQCGILSPLPDTLS